MLTGGGLRGERPRSPRVKVVRLRQPERSPEGIAAQATPEGRSGGCTWGLPVSRASLRAPRYGSVSFFPAQAIFFGWTARGGVGPWILLWLHPLV